MLLKELNPNFCSPLERAGKSNIQSSLPVFIRSAEKIKKSDFNSPAALAGLYLTYFTFSAPFLSDRVNHQSQIIRSSGTNTYSLFPTSHSFFLRSAERIPGGMLQRSGRIEHTFFLSFVLLCVHLPPFCGRRGEKILCSY
jgi:hypothetical protein